MQLIHVNVTFSPLFLPLRDASNALHRCHLLLVYDARQKNVWEVSKWYLGVFPKMSIHFFMALKGACSESKQAFQAIFLC